MRILFVSYYFPPSSSIGTVRIGKTAKYLRTFGHDVRVVTARVQSGMEQSLPVEIPSEVVLRVPWPSPDSLAAPLLSGRRAAASAGLASPNSKWSVVAACGRVFRAMLQVPDEGGPGLPLAYAAALRKLGSWRPDIVFASAMPASSLVLAAILARKYGVPWVGELRDLWTDNHLYPYGYARRWVDSRIEYRTLASAAGLVTVSEPLAKSLRVKHERPTIVVMNGFDPEDFPHDARPPADATLHVAYTGGLAGQDVMPLIEALVLLGAEAARIRITFRGKFLGPHLAPVLARASELGVRSSLFIEPPVSQHAALRVQRESDVLLFLAWTATPGVYTGKLFEYAGSLRPILSIGSGMTVADDLIRERRLGVACSDPASIAEALRSWLEEKLTTGEVAGRDASAVADLTRECQTRRLEQFLAARGKLPHAMNAGSRR